MVRVELVRTGYLIEINRNQVPLPLLHAYP